MCDKTGYSLERRKKSVYPKQFFRVFLLTKEQREKSASREASILYDYQPEYCQLEANLYINRMFSYTIMLHTTPALISITFVMSFFQNDDMKQCHDHSCKVFQWLCKINETVHPACGKPSFRQLNLLHGSYLLLVCSCPLSFYFYISDFQYPP